MSTTITTTTTTTTTTAPAATSIDPWVTAKGRDVYDRFTRSRIIRDMRRFVVLAWELKELGDDLVRRMPDSEALNDYSGDSGYTIAEDLKGALWGVDIIAGLIESELPGGVRRRKPARKRTRKAKKAATTPSAPKAEPEPVTTPTLHNRISGIA